MELLDLEGKAGSGILKILPIKEILLKRLLFYNLMLNYATSLFILKYNKYLHSLLIFVHRHRMDNYYFGRLIQIYKNKNLLKLRLIPIELIVFSIIKLEIISLVVLMICHGIFGIQPNCNKFIPKKDIKDKFIVHLCILMVLYILLLI
jgi:hypothetical protein